MTTTHDSDHNFRPDEEERDYLLRRAEDHRQLAEKSEDASSRSIHLRMTRLYEEQAASAPLVVMD
jgi:hypothetical protein